jgi:hypothetical protein
MVPKIDDLIASVLLSCCKADTPDVAHVIEKPLPTEESECLAGFQMLKDTLKNVPGLLEEMLLGF